MSIVSVGSPRQLDAFIRLPWRLHSDDKTWIPPLVSNEKMMLDPRRNPFYEHAEAQHFLAEKDGRVTGRISAIVNRIHNEVHRDTTGFWGYFECEDDAQTAKDLFDAAASWLKERGMTVMRGPASPSMNDPCGLLVKGFKYAPFVLMPHNPPYYQRLVEGAGFLKSMDLLAYMLLQTELVKGRIDRVASTVRDRGSVIIRTIDLSRFDEELALIQDMYNDAWEKNWSFVPMTPKEMCFMAREMKPILLPEFAYIAEVDGKPVGFAFALPDINHSLRRCKGSLFPFGWFYFLKRSLRKIKALRIVALGVRRDYQHLGIGTLFYQKFIETGLPLGYKAAELSWVLETNELMNRPLREMGARPYKVYRMYDRAIE